VSIAKEGSVGCSISSCGHPTRSVRRIYRVGAPWIRLEFMEIRISQRTIEIEMAE
jgi:hypothetical protein